MVSGGLRSADIMDCLRLRERLARYSNVKSARVSQGLLSTCLDLVSVRKHPHHVKKRPQSRNAGKGDAVLLYVTAGRTSVIAGWTEEHLVT
jgi:hypothetical protein